MARSNTRIELVIGNAEMIDISGASHLNDMWEQQPQLTGINPDSGIMG